jgi:glutathione S-transferase
MGFAPMIEGEKKAEELKKVEEKLAEFFKLTVGDRKFIGGDKPCIADYKLFPMLNILNIQAAVNFGYNASDKIKT